MRATMNYKIINKFRKEEITHIAFDMVDKETKTFYGFAQNLKWGSMCDVARVSVKGSDDVFEKALALYERGVNMFECGNGIVVIE